MPQRKMMSFQYDKTAKSGVSLDDIKGVFVEARKDIKNFVNGEKARKVNVTVTIEK